MSCCGGNNCNSSKTLTENSMSEEINKDPIDIDEKVDKITFHIEDKIPTSEVISRLDEFKTKLLRQKYTDVKMGLERRSKEEIDIVLFGSRQEDKDETSARVAQEEAQAKFIKEQQLKEYLKLKRLFENEGTSDGD